MKLQLLFLFAAVIVYVSSEETWTCQKDVNYRENNCNNCGCTNDGKLACTRRECFGDETSEMSKCTEYGKETEKGCNKCVCTKEYGTVCTTNKC